MQAVNKNCNDRHSAKKHNHPVGVLIILMNYNIYFEKQAVEKNLLSKKMFCMARSSYHRHWLRKAVFKSPHKKTSPWRPWTSVCIVVTVRHTTEPIIVFYRQQFAAWLSGGARRCQSNQTTYSVITDHPLCIGPGRMCFVAAIVSWRPRDWGSIHKNVNIKSLSFPGRKESCGEGEEEDEERGRSRCMTSRIVIEYPVNDSLFFE